MLSNRSIISTKLVAFFSPSIVVYGMSVVPYPIIDSSKPREERDYKELYPDLDEQDQLKVYIQVKSNDPEDVNEAAAASGDSVIADHSVVANEIAAANGSGSNGVVKKLEADTVSGITGLKKPSFRKISKHAIQYPKFSKALMDYGFQDPTKPLRKQSSKTLTRPFSCEDIQEMSNKKRKLVEYDLDEQDLLFLAHRNSQPDNSMQLTPEIFEVLITTLENEWNSLELKISSKESSSGSFSLHSGILKLDNGGDVHKYGNDDGIVEGSFMEQKCAICNDSDCDNSNAIVFCDGCDIAVHQECYGIAFIPEGQWLCRKCMINKNREVKCIFCPSTTGAFKQLDSSLWSHVLCALWISELYFANPIYMEPIEGIDLIPKNRWKLTCYICKQRNVGACIQCHNRNCFQAYHVTCAKRSGLYMKLTKGVSGAIANKATLRTYCDKHGPADKNHSHSSILRGIEKTKLYFRDLKILNDKNAKILKKKEADNKVNVFKWKTENDTPIAPHKFAHVLEQKLIELKVMERHVVATNGRKNGESSNGRDNAPAFLRDLEIAPNTSKEMKLKEIKQMSFDICKYWCLKREMKNGAPLTRKNNNMELSSIIYGSNDPDEIHNKLEFGKVLTEDLNRVLKLVESIVERQNLVAEVSEINSEVLLAIYFPVREVILKLLVKYLPSAGSLSGLNYASNATNRTSLESLHQRAETFEFDTVSAFVDELNTVCTQMISENVGNKKSNSAVVTKLAKRIIKEMESQNWEALEKAIKDDMKGSRGDIHLPFVETNGSNVSFIERDVHSELLNEELSEVESLNEEENGELRNLVQPV